MTVSKSTAANILARAEYDWIPTPDRPRFEDLKPGVRADLIAQAEAGLDALEVAGFVLVPASTRPAAAASSEPTPPKTR